MIKRTTLKATYYTVWALIIAMCVFWLYLNLLDQEVRFSQAQAIATIQEQYREHDRVDFVVVGDVKSSVRTFAETILPAINIQSNLHSNTQSNVQSNAQAHVRGVDFVVSAGNAVADGSEESYRRAYDIFSKLQVPYVLAFGENEAAGFGQMRFYDKVGPHFFSFTAATSQFIFLDLTGTTEMAWQLDWLRQTLAQSEQRYQFVFTGLPMHNEVTSHDKPQPYAKDRVDPDSLKTLHELFKTYEVDAVFAANMPLYRQLQQDGVTYVTTGGAGGLILDQDDSYHHYVHVTADNRGVAIDAVEVNVAAPGWQRALDSTWSALLTFLYVSYLRFMLIVALLIVIGVRLYQVLYMERRYYPDFTLDSSAHRDIPKRVLMATNNYFPFLSGVVVSIERLVQGLTAKGHKVAMLAPDYGRAGQEKSTTCEVIRVPTLLRFTRKADFRYSNIFSRRARQQASAFKPDIIHVHHPFALGTLGLWLGRRLRIPVVYTYHTRLEMYAHYVPLPGRLFRNVISHQIVRRFCNRCDGVVVPTGSVEDYLRMVGVKSRILVQPTGIDSRACETVEPDAVESLRQRYQLPTDSPVLISVSRLSDEKNLCFLLYAFASLQPHLASPPRLLLVGDGPQRQELEQLAKKLAIDSLVVFCGAVSPDDVNAHYRLADLFVFTSKSETQGMVILEAMSCGLPVVAVRASGIDEVVLDGETGYKVTEQVEPWVEGVRRLLHDKALHAQFSRAAKELAARHDVAVFADNINQFYAEVLAARDAAEVREE